jgi:subtilisin family serine protease
MSLRSTPARAKKGLTALLTLALALVAVSLAGGATAAESAKSYIVVMEAAPAVAYEGGVSGLPATKPGKGKKINPNNDNVKKYRAHLESSHNASLNRVGASGDKINDYSIALNGYSAILSEEQAAAVEQQKGVALVMEDQLRQPTTDSSPAYLGLTAPGGAYATGYDGRGVVVGVIDSGIWPEHPSFAGAGFPAPPTGSLPCEFGNTAHNTNDAPFTCNNKLIGAYQMLETYRALIGAAPDEFDSARDDNGHGTHTASTAAGNANVPATVLGTSRGRITGIAPRAHVIAYKGLGNLGGFTSDLAAAIDQAVADGVDVINYSVGSGPGLPGGDEIAFLFAADAGVFVATSAGNSGPGIGTVGNPATMPWMTTVGANTQSRFFQGAVELGNGARYVGASITKGVGTAPLVDAVSLGNPLCNPGPTFGGVAGPTFPAGSLTGKIVVCQRGTVGRAAKSLAVKNAGGVGMVMHENSDQGNLFSDSHWVPSVHVDRTPGLAIKAYIAANPGTATARIVGEQVSTWVPGGTSIAPSMVDFSSRGPNAVAPDVIKPDVTAPGIQILAGNSPFPDPNTTPPGDLFQAIAGTSMSSPHVAGVFALLKQANPDWSAAMAKSALMTTASQNVRDNDRTTIATPFEQGAGHVTPGRPNQKGSAFQPGLAYDAGLFEYAAFTCGMEWGVFTPGTCTFLQNAGVPMRPIDLNLPSIGIAQVAGSETVTRTVTSVAKENGNRTYAAVVNAPPGYTVNVSPSSFTLKPGETAEFEITVTNVSAPNGEWRFGSLTWRDQTGNYSPYSPIAVKGVPFSAPVDDVTSTGPAPNASPASYQIRFGFTGSPFGAAPRGLVPAALTANTVPDDPTNGTCGLSTPGTFQVPVVIPAGTTYARFQLFAADSNPNTDIDMCVFLGTTQVGTSTSATSDEIVNLSSPAGGSYTVVVHGWQAGTSGSPFKLHSWVLGSAAAGNMVVSAPSSATIGTVATIGLTFNGLLPATKYLGSVAYSGVPGSPAPTIVRVNTT